MARGRRGVQHPERAITDALELVASALAGLASQIGFLPAPPSSRRTRF